MNPSPGEPVSEVRLEGRPLARRFPIAFGVHREGPLYGLYVAPAGLDEVVEAIRLPPGARALVPDRDGGATVIDWAEVGSLPGDAEVVHLAPGADPEAVLAELPVPLLGAPERAVPVRRGSLVAVSLDDGCHATVLAPRLGLLRDLLHRLVLDLQVARIDGDADPPRLEPRQLDAVLAPQPADRWWGLRVETQPRVLVMEAVLHDDLGPLRNVRWVAERRRGRWRFGWSW